MGAAMECVYALILNDNDCALVRHVSTPGNTPYWTMLKAKLPTGQNPICAAQAELDSLGYRAAKWMYLGTYVDGESRVIHFLFAKNARLQTVATPGKNGVQWVSLEDLRYALLDGRIGKIGDATSIALAMYLTGSHAKREVTWPQKA